MPIQAKEAGDERLPLLIHVLHIPPTWVWVHRMRTPCAPEEAAEKISLSSSALLRAALGGPFRADAQRLWRLVLASGGRFHGLSKLLRPSRPAPEWASASPSASDCRPPPPNDRTSPRVLIPAA
jgi:hypothetical protein